MITLIGTSTTAIGFGLCGIKDIHEIKRKQDPQEIADMIVNAENQIVMIDEDVYDKVYPLMRPNNKIIIKIPFRHKDETKSDDIDDLVRDTLGVAIKTEES